MTSLDYTIEDFDNPIILKEFIDKHCNCTIKNRRYTNEDYYSISFSLLLTKITATNFIEFIYNNVNIKLILKKHTLKLYYVVSNDKNTISIFNFIIDKISKVSNQNNKMLNIRNNFYNLPVRESKVAKKVDLTGKIYGKLTVISYANDLNITDKWNCVCECGNKIQVKSTNFKSGHTKSCGCMKSENTASITHHLSKTIEYSTWANIKTRCYNKDRKDYHNYGGRGIIMCDQWKNSFETFLLDMGQRPTDKHSIDKIEVNGNYEPSNCKWSTGLEQANNKRNTTIITYQSQTRTLKDWSIIINIPLSVLRHRLQRNWSIEKMLTQKLKKR